MEKETQIIEKITSIYGHNASKVLQGMQTEPKTVFRINTLRHSKHTLFNLEQQGFDFRALPISNTYVLEAAPNVAKLSNTEQFQNGEIYIQGLSSMMSVFTLDPKEDDEILDLCAAPGSKTSLIAALTQNQAAITAVEKNKTRYQKLVANLERLGVTSVNSVFADGYTLPKQRPEFMEKFDKILVDAPCSNEGYIILNDPKSYAFWNKRKFADMVWQQKGLLFSGFSMLKPGGTLVYSTCTFSVEENEEIVHELIKKFPNASVEDFELPEETSYLPGLTHWNQKAYDSTLANTKRILPDQLHRPFFIAKILKNNT